jgi:ATP-dependent Zn protease
LTERRSVLDQIAHRLLDKEVLDGDALRELVAADAPAARAVV